MPRHRWGHQSRSLRERVAVRVAPRGGILVGATETTRAVGTAAGARARLVVNQVILVEEGIQVRAEEETEDVEFTRAFFIRIILRVLWRRVLR